MITSKYFSESEFNRCNPRCSLQDMDQEFMNKLDALREKAGIPLVLNSAFRTVAHEKARGRSGNSAHTTRNAVDIRCNTSINRFKILRAAFILGFTRIGGAKTFIHVDRSETLPQNVFWTY